MEKISVIVPVYKVEQYLNRCIRSIVDQTYKNLEIILVDDGSPDNCGAMCDLWAQKDPRIRVIHKENGGLSSARNAGIEAAVGSLISFVDSDDFLAPEVYSVLSDAIQQTGSDIAACRYEKFTDEAAIKADSDSGEYYCLNVETALKELIANGLVQQVVWNKLYRKAVIQDLPFEIGKQHEDEYWSYQVIGRSKQLVLCDHTGYFYYQRHESIMGTQYSLKRLDSIEAKCLRQQYLEKYFPSLALSGHIDLITTCLYHGQLSISSLKGQEVTQAVQYLKDIIKKHPISNTVLSGCGIKQKLWFSAAKLNFTGTCRIRNFLRIGF